MRAGSAAGKILASQDGVNFEEVGTYSTTKKGEFSISTSLAEESKYVRVTNTTSGTLFIHGIKIFTVGEAEPDGRADCDLKAVTTSKELNIKDSYTLTKGTDYTTTSTGEVTFSSANPRVATVDANGKITGVAEGTTTVTISQAGTETIKSGTAIVVVTVKDPRAASTFALSSENAVSIKEGETSSIKVANAAGAVTYTSSKADVATVSAEGVISAVAAGTAVITVTDAGTDAVKGGSLTVSVTVTKDMTGKTVVTFSKPSSGKVPVSSDETLVSFGGTTNYKDGAYGDYPYGVKLESATEIYLTPASNATVTLIFDVATDTYLNGKIFTPDTNGEYQFEATAGTKYTITKKNSTNLYAVIFDFGGEKPDPKPDPDPDPDPTEEATVVYDYFAAEAIGSTAMKSEGTADAVKAGTVKINTNSTNVNGISFGKSITLTDKVVSDYYINITPAEGGFEAGDTLVIAGAYNNSAEKLASIKVFNAESDSIYNTEYFINGRLVATAPVVEKYVLTKATPSLYLGRNGGTTTFITTLQVIRPAKKEGLKGDVNGDNTVDVKDINAIISVMSAGSEDEKADVNEDKQVDVKDINAVISIMSGN